MSGQIHKMVLYSHDSLGLGHVRRNLAIAHHMAQHLPGYTGRKLTGLMLSGVATNDMFRLPSGFDRLVLPGICKTNDGYRARHMFGDTQALLGLRSNLLEAALISFAPDLVVVDRHVFGVQGELRAPLRRLRSEHPGTKVVLGLREVLDDPRGMSGEWQGLGDIKAVRECIDEIWVYGDRTVHDPVLTGEVPQELSDMVRFTGYLSYGRELAEHGIDAETTPYVLTTVGGGADGARLLETAVGVQPPAGHRHLVVTGPQFDHAARTAIAAAAPPDTRVAGTCRGMSARIRNASAVMSMGGYNTTCEILATGTPALLVPRERPRREQLIRAQALHRAGIVDLTRSEELSTAGLERWLSAAVRRRVDRSSVNRDGLDGVVRLAARLLDGSSREAGVGR